MFTKSSLRPAFSLLIGIALTASACGISIGDDKAASLDSGIGAPVEETSGGDAQAEGSETGTTDSTSSAAAPVVSLPTNDSGPTDGATDGRIEPIADQNNELTAEVDEAFCAASARYWAAANAGPHIDRDNPAEVSMLWSLTESRLDEAIALAPNEKLAEPALVARENFTVLYAALSHAKFNLDAIENGRVYDEIEPSLRMLLDISDLLGTYLIGPCGYTRQAIEASAVATASDVSQLVADLSAESDAGSDYPGDYIEIADSTDRLKVEVPIDWEDTQSEPSGAGSALTIAPNVSSYLTSWRADGLKMTVSDAKNPIDWRQPMYETNASAECTLISSLPYSDSLYTGWVDRYDNCGGGPASAVVIGATDEDFSVEILVEVQFDNVDTQNDEATLNQILDTFKAR